MNMDEPEFYRDKDVSARIRFRDDSTTALEYYEPFIEFVTAVCPPIDPDRKKLLDVGCGNGWSTHLLARRGFDACGIDLSPSQFEPPATDRCKLVYGSALQIPFTDDTFDVVTTHACLEHVTDPRQALVEMSRVCKPGGIVTIVGPNLISPFPALIYNSRSFRWLRLPLFRRAEMPRHPFGDTSPEILAISLLRAGQLLRKLCLSAPQFTMREPDLRPPAHADSDACYLLNPTDLIAFFKSRGFAIIEKGKVGRPRWTYLFAGGTWIAARKPTGG